MHQRLEMIGRLGSMKTSTTAKGIHVENFSVVTEKNYKSAAGEWVTDTTWFDCVAFGKTGELFASKGMQKGDLVRLEGEIRFRDWEDKEGIKRRSTEVIVREVPQKLPRYWKSDGGNASGNAQPPATLEPPVDDAIGF